MKKKELKIELIDEETQIPFRLLESADPSRAQIEKYLISGKCYTAKLGNEMIGVIVLKEITPASIEIKNIAIDKACRGKGFGRQLLKFAVQLSRQSGYEKLIIGTGNSSIGQLALYQKEGFEICEFRRNYFVNNYEEPIFENGIQCKHLIMLVKRLN